MVSGVILSARAIITQETLVLSLYAITEVTTSIGVGKGEAGGPKPPNFKIRRLAPPGLHSRLCTQ